ncbi:MAG TPA: Rrf2 family transcriptional regulator [Sedimentisphaerales bacterium]|nr:Rrf2 family transcriptional regulator [Sedimentisphaerales bacterium]
MNLLRQNTDYAFRLLVGLGRRRGELVNVRVLAEECQVSQQFAAKIMQKLHDDGLVESVMGPKGGFRLAMHPSGIDLLAVIRAIQGPVVVNTCLLGAQACERQASCPVTGKLTGLQDMMETYLRGITLDDLLAGSLDATQTTERA